MRKLALSLITIGGLLAACVAYEVPISDRSASQGDRTGYLGRGEAGLRSVWHSRRSQGGTIGPGDHLYDYFMPYQQWKENVLGPNGDLSIDASGNVFQRSWEHEERSATATVMAFAKH